jgi:prepilin-type N-terminal cleavage/methylation domain-containing protein
MTVRKSQGFTMVELMVVIAIIAVLAAIIIPVYSRSQETARQTTCKGNLHAVAIAMRNFLTDNGAFPQPYNPYTGEGGITQLYLEGYLQSNKVLRCPDDPTNVRTYNEAHADLEDWVDWDEQLFAERYSSYNELLGADAGSTYSLYNHGGYSGHPDQPSDYPDPPGCSQGWAAVRALMDAYATYTLEDCTLAWANPIYGRVDLTDHPNFDQLTGDTYGRVFDRPNPATDEYARPLFSGAAEFQYTAYFPGLINPNAPDNTIITHCPWHRHWFGRGIREQDIIVRLSGDTDTALVYTYDWVVQRPQ